MGTGVPGEGRGEAPANVLRSDFVKFASRLTDEGRGLQLALPAHQGRAPGESGAEAADHSEGVSVDTAALHGLGEGKGDRAGGGVAVAVEIVEDSGAGDVQDV